MKNNATHKQYMKERKRLQAMVRRMEKRGYYFPSYEKIVPKKPKRITKSSVQKLKRIKPDIAYKAAYYIVPETGEAIKGTEGRKLKRKAAYQKGVETKLRKAKMSLPFGGVTTGAPGEPPELPGEHKTKSKKFTEAERNAADGGKDAPQIEAPAENLYDMVYEKIYNELHSSFEHKYRKSEYPEGGEIVLRWMESVEEQIGKRELGRLLHELELQGVYFGWVTINYKEAALTYIAQMQKLLPPQYKFSDEMMVDLEEASAISEPVNDPENYGYRLQRSKTRNPETGEYTYYYVKIED